MTRDDWLDSPLTGSFRGEKVRGNEAEPKEISGPTRREGTNIDYIHELISILRRLRAPGGCPWDREQTHQTLKRFLVEETGELLDAIEDEDDQGMVDELGDVLLQIVFHARIAAEEGRFDIQDVARSECEKMIRRHPHVFGADQIDTAAGVVDQWEEIKQEEKGGRDRDRSAIAGVPRHLPGLHRAQKIQHKAAAAGFEWENEAGYVDKIREELREVTEALTLDRTEAIAEEIGDLMFAIVNLARRHKLEAEELMHAAIRKFDRRFRALEEGVAGSGERIATLPPAELLARWKETK